MILPFILESKSIAHLPFPRDRGKWIRCIVKSSAEIGLYVVDGKNMKEYLGGLDWHYQYAGGRELVHELEFKAPYSDMWHVVVRNSSEKDVAVYIECHAIT